jgi:hypothetical protein
MTGQWAILVVALVVVLSVAVWASDRISYDGERTIYTVHCENGAWDGLRCNGKLTAAERYRFRASKSKQEVLYWIVGSPVPSGKYTNCAVKDRGNWSCKVGIDQPPTIAFAIIDDRPISTDTGPVLPFYAVRKWKWWLLRVGVRISNKADF